MTRTEKSQPRAGSEEEVKTGAEMAAEADAARAEATGGIECPKCGCRHLHIYKTVPKGTLVKRRRQCRNCGHRLGTTERIET